MKVKKVFCWGTFDLLHRGHVEFLRWAKNKGDYLGVIVISDKVVMENKGHYSVESQQERVRKIKATGLAEEVLAMGDDFEKNLQLIAKMRPDVFVFGYDQRTELEEKLKIFLKEKGVRPRYLRATKAFAGGIHTRDLMKSVN